MIVENKYQPNPNRYSLMQYRKCGNSGLHLPAISMGLWHNFGFTSCFDNARKMCRTAFDLGIHHFDLANNYGPPPGSAEVVFGRILSSDLRAHRDELIISTKAGYEMWPGPCGNGGSRKYLISSLDQSLQRMGLDYVDIFYSHCYDPHTPLEETMEALAQIVKSGKALYVGISSYRNEQTIKATKILSELGIRCTIHQPSYSMNNRWIEHDNLIDTLDQQGTGAIAFSPLSQGILTNKYLNGIPEDSRAAADLFLQKKEITSDTIAKIHALNEIASGRGQSLAQMSIAWVLKDPRITSALIGASRPSQISECVSSLKNTEFSQVELNTIEDLANSLPHR